MSCRELYPMMLRPVINAGVVFGPELPIADGGQLSSVIVGWGQC